MSRLLSCLACFFILNAGVQAQENGRSYESLSLADRPHVIEHTVHLESADWQWLREKKVLILGTSLTDTPPLDLPSNLNDYQGLTADYVELLADLLGVRIEVRRYAVRSEAVEALKAGEVDFLGSSGRFEEADPGLLRSRAYLDDQPVLVTRRGVPNPQPSRAKGLRLAVFDHYAEPAQILKYYPDARLQQYPTAQLALGAVEFGQADVYLGGAIGSSYLIAHNFFNDLHLADFASLEVTDIGFVVQPDNRRLLTIINRALVAIPSAENQTIAKRWGRYSIAVHSRESVDLSPREAQWLSTHPRLRVAVMGNNAPVSFFDQNNVFRGIGADLLEKISHLTNLKFDVVRAETFDESVDMVLSGKADLIVAFYPNVEKESQLRVTRPYLTDPFVLITRQGDTEPVSLEEMAGKRVAIRPGGKWREYLMQQYPQITLVNSLYAADGMAKVARGEADASINSLINARYLITTSYSDSLRIGGTVGPRPATLSLATGRGQLELYSILDKTLISIPQEELSAVINSWRGEAMLDNSYWYTNRLLVLEGFGVLALLLLLAFGWNTYLRRLINKRELAEHALSEQMAFMRALLDSLPHPIYVRDRQTRLLMCNKRYLEALSSTWEQIGGKLASEVSPIGIVYENRYLDVMAKGQERIEDMEIELPNGQLVMVYWWVLPYRGSDGEVKGVIGGWIDISERERLSRQLKEAKQEADNANRAKTTFLATMSHEIRTPMNAMTGGFCIKC